MYLNVHYLCAQSLSLCSLVLVFLKIPLWNKQSNVNSLNTMFYCRLVNSTTYLSEAALHLFLQTNLSVKEIERILDGKDCRDITDFIKQDYTALTPVILRRKSTPHTNADSGFSGSTNLDLNSPGKFRMMFSILFLQNKGPMSEMSVILFHVSN